MFLVFPDEPKFWIIEKLLNWKFSEAEVQVDITPNHDSLDLLKEM